MEKAVFSEREKLFLVQLITDENEILENKKTDGCTLKLKNEAWGRITVIFNSQGFSKRSAKQLKKCWENIKQRKRKLNTTIRQEQLMTGGGPPIKSTDDPVMDFVDAAAPNLDVEVKCCFDSTAMYEAKNEVVVEYDYTGKESDELTIKKGDIIKNVVKKPGGWWEGFLKDKRGMFPDNFVRSLDQDSSVILRNKKDVSRIRQCRVVFSYSQDHEDELNLNVGDVINIVGEEEEGWWRGILNGKEGVFPSNFVEEIVPQSCPKPTNREDITSAAEVRVPKLPSKPSKQFCEVKFAYKAQNDDELTLEEGEVITLISKDSQDPGWWKGELNGHIGVFPDNFVTLISSYDDRGSHKDENKSSNIDTGATKPSSIALQRKSLEIKNEKVNGDPNVSISKSPPVPGKKPLIPIKKSSSGSGVGIFSEIKKKLVDVVDGATGSKSAKPEAEIKTSGNAFDQVERRSLLTDIRATRAKPPGRRLPTVLHKDADITVFNGNAEHLIEPDVQSNNIPESENFEKRRVREWEKHKAPWLEEMKLNQSKRTSTSPGPESKLKLTPTTDSNTGLDDTNLDKFVGKQTDLSKVVPPMDLSKSLSSVDNMQNIMNEEEKPILPSAVLNRQSLPLNLKDIIKDSSAVKAPKGSSTSPVTSKDPVLKKPVIEKSIEREPNIENHDISYMQYRELFERLQKLEVMFENQNKVIEDLKNKLQIETDMRMMLQEKVLQKL